MNGVSYDDDLGDGFIGAGLINAVPDGEKLCLYASHECGIMYCLCKRPISYVDVWNRHSNIIFDASISYDESCKRWQRVVENYVIEFLCVGFVIFFLSFLVTKLKEKWLGKISTMWEPGENSWLRGEKDEKMP